MPFDTHSAWQFKMMCESMCLTWASIAYTKALITLLLSVLLIIAQNSVYNTFKCARAHAVHMVCSERLFTWIISPYQNVNFGAFGLCKYFSIFRLSYLIVNTCLVENLQFQITIRKFKKKLLKELNSCWWSCVHKTPIQIKIVCTKIYC